MTSPIESQRAFLERMAAEGWQLENTGGGCEAFRRDLPDGRHLLLTCEDDPSVPRSWDSESCVVGLYDKEEHSVGDDFPFWFFPCVRDAMVALREVPL